MTVVSISVNSKRQYRLKSAAAEVTESITLTGLAPVTAADTAWEQGSAGPCSTSSETPWNSCLGDNRQGEMKEQTLGISFILGFFFNTSKTASP